MKTYIVYKTLFSMFGVRYLQHRIVMRGSVTQQRVVCDQLQMPNYANYSFPYNSADRYCSMRKNVYSFAFR
jgi:hypothetical protein